MNIPLIFPFSPEVKQNLWTGGAELWMLPRFVATSFSYDNILAFPWKVSPLPRKHTRRLYRKHAWPEAEFANAKSRIINPRLY
jgi:hypothetical protein